MRKEGYPSEHLILQVKQLDLMFTAEDLVNSLQNHDFEVTSSMRGIQLASQSGKS
jgi:hypothetical protein